MVLTNSSDMLWPLTIWKNYPNISSFPNINSSALIRLRSFQWRRSKWRNIIYSYLFQYVPMISLYSLIFSLSLSLSLHRLLIPPCLINSWINHHVAWLNMLPILTILTFIPLAWFNGNIFHETHIIPYISWGFNGSTMGFPWVFPPFRAIPGLLRPAACRLLQIHVLAQGLAERRFGAEGHVQALLLGQNPMEDEDQMELSMDYWDICIYILYIYIYIYVCVYVYV